MFSFVSIFALLLSHSAFSIQWSNQDQIQKDLDQWARDPAQFYQLHNQKYDSFSGIEKKTDKKPSLADLDQIIELKQKMRPQFFKERSTQSSDLFARLFPFSEYDPDVDQAQRLVDNYQLSKLDQMQNASKMVAKLQSQPWSDSYWPLYLGNLAYRYGDPNHPRSTDWKVNSDYLMNSLGDKSLLNILSPAEKYDLFVGDSAFGLTRAALETGGSLYRTYGFVQDWQGICHGWSPAAYMYSRPKHSIRVKGAQGQMIEFYPSDIKALASMHWANGTPRTRFIGTRCKLKDLAKLTRDQISAACLDTNPATWHLSIVNQIGVSNRSFVMDATVDFEVWNQPVYAYHYSYFNPKTHQLTQNNLGAATAWLTWPNNFDEDPYKKYRSPGTKAIVGIVMDVVYMSETAPNQNTVDSEDMDDKTLVRYYYDLELDGNGNILGGEWYTKEHPDFLWTPAPDDRAFSYGDAYVASSGVTGAAQIGSKNAQPLSQVVRELIDLSQ